MGMTVEMVEKKGPSFPEPLRHPSDMSRLRKEVDVKKELGYVFDAIKMTRKKLDGRVPLLGFVGAPWTLMSYMIEGGGSKTFQFVKEWVFTWPKDSKELLERITTIVVEFLARQVEAGAQVFPLSFPFISLRRADKSTDDPSLRLLGRRTRTFGFPNLFVTLPPEDLCCTTQAVTGNGTRTCANDGLC
jgi:hypothetical protein